MWWRARRGDWLWLLMGAMVLLASLFWLGRRPLRLSPDTPVVQGQMALEQASIRDERTLVVILGADEAFRRDVPPPYFLQPWDDSVQTVLRLPDGTESPLTFSLVQNTLHRTWLERLLSLLLQTVSGGRKERVWLLKIELPRLYPPDTPWIDVVVRCRHSGEELGRWRLLRPPPRSAAKYAPVRRSQRLQRIA